MEVEDVLRQRLLAAALLEMRELEREVWVGFFEGEVGLSLVLLDDEVA